MTAMLPLLQTNKFPSKQQVVIRHLTFYFHERVKNPQNRVSQKILDLLQNHVPSRSVSYKAVSHEALLYTIAQSAK